MEPLNTNLPMRELPLTPPAEIKQDPFENSDTSTIVEDLPKEAHFHPVVAVIGIGYVGSHLVQAFARVYEVIAFDISEQKVEQISQQFQGLPVRCTSHAPDLKIADAFLISVPTTIHSNTDRNPIPFEEAVRTVTQHAQHGAIVVVESSVAVGTTRKLLSPLVATKNVKVGMSPERIDPGRELPAFHAIPKVISGIDASSLYTVRLLYEQVFDHLVPVSSLEVAEMTKLYENCQRMVCAAYANEMADACAIFGISGWEVSMAAASKPYGYLPIHPGAGVGGNCIPVNPWYLFENFDMMHILQYATEACQKRPRQIVQRLVDVLQDKRDAIRSRLSLSASNTRVLVVGVGFKRGQSELHHSPGVDAIQYLLQDHQLVVEFADPLVNQEDLPHVPKLDISIHWNKEYLETFDGILVTMNQVGLDMNLLVLLDEVVVHNYTPS